LNPVKRKQISEKTAELTGHDVTLVDEVASFYYNHIQRKLATLDHVNVNVPNLGTFVLIKSRLDAKLQRYEAFLSHVETQESMKAYETRLNVKHHIGIYQNAQAFMNAEYQRKTEVKQKKREHAEERDQSTQGA